VFIVKETPPTDQCRTHYRRATSGYSEEGEKRRHWGRLDVIINCIDMQREQALLEVTEQSIDGMLACLAQNLPFDKGHS
jgi:hypothetical protein